jgi:hypothetical protein
MLKQRQTKLAFSMCRLQIHVEGGQDDVASAIAKPIGRSYHIRLPREKKVELRQGAAMTVFSL